MSVFLDHDQNAPVPLTVKGGFSDRVHVFERDDLHALDAAYYARRPLLVQGRPGTGKSQLAFAAAELLRRPVVFRTIDARTVARDLLYEIDMVERLATAQVQRPTSESIDEELSLMKFVRPGPLWRALSWSKAHEIEPCELAIPAEWDWTPNDGVVVLLDEMDKAEPEVPNGLLEVLGEGRFTGPSRADVVSLVNADPIVIVTTNDERDLPDAFLRRCIVHCLELPVEEEAFVEFLVRRGRENFSGCTVESMRTAAVMLFEDRGSARGYQAGMAEFFDVLRVLDGQSEDKQQMALDRVRPFIFQKRHGSVRETAIGPPANLPMED